MFSISKSESKTTEHMSVKFFCTCRKLIFRLKFTKLYSPEDSAVAFKCCLIQLLLLKRVLFLLVISSHGWGHGQHWQSECPGHSPAYKCCTLQNSHAGKSTSKKIILSQVILQNSSASKVSFTLTVRFNVLCCFFCRLSSISL